MSQLPHFGEGSRATRRSRRLALGIAAFLVAIILALVVYAIAG
jgi:flagellar biosynthesis/type III secretory pathway M-ring protein FliF/YscJ